LFVFFYLLQVPFLFSTLPGPVILIFASYLGFFAAPPPPWATVHPIFSSHSIPPLALRARLCQSCSQQSFPLPRWSLVTFFESSGLPKMNSIETRQRMLPRSFLNDRFSARRSLLNPIAHARPPSRTAVFIAADYAFLSQWAAGRIFSLWNVPASQLPSRSQPPTFWERFTSPLVLDGSFSSRCCWRVQPTKCLFPPFFADRLFLSLVSELTSCFSR